MESGEIGAGFMISDFRFQIWKDAPRVAPAFGLRRLDGALALRARDARMTGEAARGEDRSALHVARCSSASTGERQSGVNPFSLPASRRAVVQSRRDCVLQPRVARDELPWGQRATQSSTPTGL